MNVIVWIGKIWNEIECCEFVYWIEKRPFVFYKIAETLKSERMTTKWDTFCLKSMLEKLNPMELGWPFYKLKIN